MITLGKLYRSNRDDVVCGLKRPIIDSDYIHTIEKDTLVIPINQNSDGYLCIVSIPNKPSLCCFGIRTLNSYFEEVV